MKEIKLWKVIVAVLAVLLVIFIIKLIKGAVTVSTAALNTVLGIVVVVAALLMMISFFFTFKRNRIAE